MTRGLLLILLLASPVLAQESYPIPEDAKEKAGVAKGRIEGPFSIESEIFPGTERQYWIYVPAAYDADAPACLCVVQDGLNKAKQYRIPTVFDNLIAEKAMPVTLGLFVTPGVVPAGGEDAQPRFNRSFEYDSMGDRYARFLIEELIPEVQKNYEISDDPNDRMICGSSSGGVCAWTAAWERPDAFRRVFSSVGTFVDLRGADAYPAMIRKYEPKPIRVFLQDGSNDLDIYAGSWWEANRAMLSALEWASYEVKFAWGDGGHNTKHAAAVFPEAVRWLWHDYPEPIKARHAQKRRMDILIEGEGWELVSGGHKMVDGPAVNASGEVFFPDVRTGEIYKVSLDGEVSTFVAKKTPEELLAEAKEFEPKRDWSVAGETVYYEPTTGETSTYGDSRTGASGLMFDAAGKLYAIQPRLGRVVRFDAEGQPETLFDQRSARLNDLVVTEKSIYVTWPDRQIGGFVMRTDLDGKRLDSAHTDGRPNGLHTTADGRFLWVTDSIDRAVLHVPLKADGSFADEPPLRQRRDVQRQDYGYLHLAPTSQVSGGDGMTVDTEGRAYVGTPIGVQVMDQLGRVHVILDSPNGEKVTNVCFGGKELNVLYAAAGTGLYRRKLNATGVVPSRGPVKPPKPGL